MTDETRYKFEPLDSYTSYKISDAAERLYKRVIAAQEQMLKDNIAHNTIVLNGNKYGYLKRPGQIPMMFGMKVETANMPEEYDFMLMNKIESKYPQTNGDRIRAMADKDLAFLLDDIYECGYSEGYSKETDECTMSPYPPTEQAWLEWLKQEVTE